MSGRKRVLVGAAGLLPVLAILGASLLVLTGCDKHATNPPSPTPGAETQTVTKPQLVSCPSQVGQAVCDFAAAAQGWLQQRDLEKLVGAGGPMDTPDNRAALLQTIDTGLVPADSPPTLRSIACPVGHDPITGILPASCEQGFSLVFATVNEKALPATGGVISLGYAVGAAGPQLVGHLVVDTSQRTYVLRGPNANGCPVAGTERNPNQCIGVTVYPVEVLGPGQTPVAVGGVETIAGAQVKQLQMGPEAPLPKDVIVYLSPAPYAAKPIEFFTPGPIDLVMYKLPFLVGPDLLLTNMSLPGTSGPFDVPATLVDLRTGLVEPVRDLGGGLSANQQPLVVGAIPGPVFRVVTGSDCLNIRQDPSVTATTRGCFKDGYSLQTAVRRPSPAGLPGLQSRRPSAMRVGRAANSWSGECGTWTPNGGLSEVSARESPAVPDSTLLPYN